MHTGLAHFHKNGSWNTSPRYFAFKNHRACNIDGTYISASTLAFSKPERLLAVIPYMNVLVSLQMEGNVPDCIYNPHYGNLGVGNVHLLVLSSWKVNIAETPIAVMGL